MVSWFRSGTPVLNPKQRLFDNAENAIMKLSQQRQGYMKVSEILYLRGPHISREALMSAVRYVQGRHPFLRSRLQNNPATPDTFLMEEDETVQLEIRDITRKRSECVDFCNRELRKHEKQISCIGQPLAELWLLQVNMSCCFRRLSTHFSSYRILMIKTMRMHHEKSSSFVNIVFVTVYLSVL